jgi:hypothetical protein
MAESGRSALPVCIPAARHPDIYGGAGLRENAQTPVEQPRSVDEAGAILLAGFARFQITMGDHKGFIYRKRKNAAGRIGDLAGYAL